VGNRFQALARAAEPPDGIICAFPTIDLADRAVRYAVERNIPIVIDVRDLWPDTFLERVPRSLRPLARLALSRDFHRTRRLFTSANALVAISGGCLAWALRYAGRKQGPRDRVFHTGYPDELVGSPHSDRPSPPAALAAANNKVLFTFSGSFGVSYNLRSVCEVARLCRNRGVTNVHFVLAGEGDQSADLARETAGLPNVTLTGWLAPGALRDLLACSHVGFMPLRSVRDAFPNKAFEYLSAGLPILSSLEGEMEQLLAESEAGFSYREGDTETLFSLVARLAHNPDLRSHMSRNARTLFEQRFRESHLYDAYAQHVERMFEPKSNGDEPGQHGDVASIPRERSMPRAHAMP
jgi:glycosyltransferase involved in cell wall biosynthesis